MPGNTTLLLGGSQAVWRTWRRPVRVFMCLWSVWVFICKSSFSLKSPEIPQNFKVSTLWSLHLKSFPSTKICQIWRVSKTRRSAVFQSASSQIQRSGPRSAVLQTGPCRSECGRNLTATHKDGDKIVGELIYKIQDQLKKFRKKLPCISEFRKKRIYAIQ